MSRLISGGGEVSLHGYCNVLPFGNTTPKTAKNWGSLQPKQNTVFENSGGTGSPYPLVQLKTSTLFKNFFRDQ